MLDVNARDGAGRTAKLSLGGREVASPGILWLEGKTPSGGPEWQPILSSAPSKEAFLVGTRRFTQVAPAGGAGQIVLQRQLVPTASVMEPDVRLETLADSVSVWGDAYALSKDPKRFAPAIAAARRKAGLSKLLYAPGLGAPHTLAVLAYAGIDLFDAIPLHYGAAQGHYLTSTGVGVAENMKHGECACPVCQLEPPASLTSEELLAHNQWAARAELGLVRNAIEQGRLRELAEQRCRAHPELTALLRRLDEQAAYFEERTPTQRTVQMWANTKESLRRAECVRFRDRVRDRYVPPTAPPVLLLLPCSARKPYSRSKTHRAVGDAVWAAGAAGLVHEVIVTSPLGLVPRELETVYPAAHYDVPVTGEWDEEEATMIRGLLTNHLAKRPYAKVISHLPRHTYDLVRDLLPAGTLVTCEGENAREPAALQRLELTLRELTKTLARANLERYLLERLRGLASVQFGPDVAEALTKGARALGKWPFAKIFADKEQLAMLPPERGLLSLTRAGAERVLALGKYTVEIENFPIKGSIFAVGVRDADPQIRVGDEVVVHHKGEFRGVGVARMSGPEMVELKRGEAVNVRHHG